MSKIDTKEINKMLMPFIVMWMANLSREEAEDFEAAMLDAAEEFKADKDEPKPDRIRFGFLNEYRGK